ncbi:MAG: cyclic nucleotide-binding domain-containing protein [Desulfobacteraceae bacterium]|jgi:CRP-like cAMP-binding protein|nr:cyclic nucleotide-binding domain-containing protein [Desulfobacteraceae bacterium]
MIANKVIPIHPRILRPKKKQLPEAGLIKKYIQEKNEQALISTFYTSIVKYAKQKQFTVAEKLREKLMELVPMALSEIIETGDIIEQEKNAALDPEKMKPFADLFNQFSKSEATAFFFALTHREVKANTPVFEQCQFDDRLYFIQSGRFILSYYDSETRQNIDFAILQKGDVADAETFFSLTSHTTTLTPIEKSNISLLSKTAYDKMLLSNPSIESKLHCFCGNRKKSCRIDHSKRQARRHYKRFSTEIKGQFHKIDANGRASREPVKIHIVDISAGGLCFVMNNNKDLDRAGLHKSWLKISGTYPVNAMMREFSTIARVVSLQILPFDDCSVHVQFKEPIDELKVMEMVQPNSMTA